MLVIKKECIFELRLLVCIWVRWILLRRMSCCGVSQSRLATWSTMPCMKCWSIIQRQDPRITVGTGYVPWLITCAHELTVLPLQFHLETFIHVHIPARPGILLSSNIHCFSVRSHDYNTAPPLSPKGSCKGNSSSLNLSSRWQTQMSEATNMFSSIVLFLELEWSPYIDDRTSTIPGSCLYCSHQCQVCGIYLLYNASSNWLTILDTSGLGPLCLKHV